MGYDLSNKISNAAKNNQVIPSVLSGVDVTLTQENRLATLGLADRTRLISNLRALLLSGNLNNLNSLTQGVSLQGTGLTGGAIVRIIRTQLGSSSQNNRLANGGTAQPFIFSLKNLSKVYPGPAKFYEGSSNNIAGHRWVFPVPPESFTVSSPASPNVITTISGNTFTHAGNIELEEISFSGFFPFFLPTVQTQAFSPNNSKGPARYTYGVTPSTNWPLYIPDYLKTGSPDFAKYYSPGEWVSNLVTAQRANQPLEFCVYAPTAPNESLVQSSENDMVIYPTKVSVIAFDWKMGGIGGDRRDVEFNITLKRWKEQRLRADTYTASIRRPQAQARTYTTKITNNVQDTLLIISQAQFPKTKMWKEIYKQNKVKIDAWYAAHKRRRPDTTKTLFNFPLPVGQKLTLPRVS